MLENKRLTDGIRLGCHRGGVYCVQTVHSTLSFAEEDFGASDNVLLTSEETH